MSQSLLIAKIFDIPVKLHWSFGLLLLIIPLALQGMGLNTKEIIFITVLVLGVFACVVMHEFGHALTAKHYGVTTKDIILLPIGGVARLNRLPEKPLHEFLIAIAGPAVNVVIAALLMPYFLFNPLSEHLVGSQPILNFETWSDLIPALLFINVALAVFNLIPAFPMDGGRVLRSLLSMKTSRLMATNIAVRVGQLFAVLFIVYAFNNNGLGLGLIGVFIFVAARQELANIRFESNLEQFTAGEVFHSKFSRLQSKDQMQIPFGYLKRVEEYNFLVFDENLSRTGFGSQDLIGTLNEKSIIKAVEDSDLDASILDYTNQNPLPGLSPNESLKSVYEKLHEHSHSILPVLDNGEILGVIDFHILNRFLDFQRKLKKGKVATKK